MTRSRRRAGLNQLGPPRRALGHLTNFYKPRKFRRWDRWRGLTGERLEKYLAKVEAFARGVDAARELHNALVHQQRGAKRAPTLATLKFMATTTPEEEDDNA